MSLKVDHLGVTKHGGRLLRLTEQGAANVALNSAMAALGANWRLISASVAYSAAPTQAGVVIKTASGAGAAYNTVLRQGSANAQYTNYPDESQGDDRGLIFGADDGLSISAPAGGAAITAAVSIYVEVI